METLRRRANRDLESLAEYYRSLDREMEEAVGRARAAEERGRRIAKWRALEGELSRSRDELHRRIRPRLGASLIAATVVHTAVERLHVEVRRRKRKGMVTLVARLADGFLEGPTCASCGTTTLTLYLCDEALHPLCPGCGQSGKLDAARCPACSGRPADAPVLTVPDPTAGLRLGPEKGGTRESSG
jgi:hypothetical protein